MQPLNVVLLQSDSGISQNLIASLANSANHVHLARSSEELRRSIVKNHAGAVILDLEISSLSDVEKLSREFPDVSIVCNHRIADEQMWTATLNAGAADCCPSSDTKGIARAALANSSPGQSQQQYGKRELEGRNFAAHKCFDLTDRLGCSK